MFQSLITIKLKYILIKYTYVIFITLCTCKRLLQCWQSRQMQ